MIGQYKAKFRSIKVEKEIAGARSIKKKCGRPTIIETKGDPNLPLKAIQMRSQGLSWSKIASNLGVGRTTARRLVCVCLKDEDDQKELRLSDRQDGG